MSAHNHNHWMHHCLKRAEEALAAVAPNPMVGAALVKDGQIIADGIHKRYGDAHAEVNAINNILVETELASAILYVTLEPCSHHGKTPPCTDLIIRSGIKHVVVATRDPNPKVHGTGIAKLREHKIEVIEDILKDEARFLNRRFFISHLKKRPYVILKWAQTSDGFIARSDYSSKWISSEESLTLVHRWRGEEQAILVGTRTALHDNPQLTTRHVSGKNPLRIVIDRKNTLPKTLNLWNSQAKTLCFSEASRSPYGNEEIIELRPAENIIPQILSELHRQQIQSVIIEGGRDTINYFIKHNSWDEARIFESGKTFSSGIAAPTLATSMIDKKSTQRSDVGGDQLQICYNTNLHTILHSEVK